MAKMLSRRQQLLAPGRRRSKKQMARERWLVRQLLRNMRRDAEMMQKFVWGIDCIGGDGTTKPFDGFISRLKYDQLCRWNLQIKA